MPYYFWYAGLMLGESDLAFSSDESRQRSGLFLPTDWGIPRMPKLAKFLAASQALSNCTAGASPMDRQSAPSALHPSLATPMAGYALWTTVEVGTDLELFDEYMRPVAFTSLVFGDIVEIAKLGRALGLAERKKPLPEVPIDSCRYVVSVTLAHVPPTPIAGRSTRATLTGSKRHQRH